MFGLGKRKPAPRWGGYFRIVRVVLGSGDEIFWVEHWDLNRDFTSWDRKVGFPSLAGAEKEADRLFNDQVILTEVVAE